MTLVLSLESSEPIAGSPARRRIEVTDRLTIGRGADNDLVLAHRQISTRHCEINFDGSGYTLTDLSKNGVYSDPGLERLPAGTPVALRQNLVLHLGPYTLTIESLSAQVSHRPAPAGFAPDPHDRLLGDPIGAEPVLQPEHLLPPAPAHSNQLIPDDIDILGNPEPVDRGWVGGSHHDHDRAEHGNFAPPKVGRESIPDDFMRDLGFDPAPPLRPAAPAPMPSAPERRPPPAAAFDAGGIDYEPLFAALGIQSNKLTPAQKAALIERIGRSMPAVIKGLFDLLAARAEMKLEFRIDRTVLGATRNNPLKFAKDEAEALRLTLLESSPGYMPADEAIKDALAGIKEHQIALLAGMRAVIAAVVSRFDPATLEKRIEGSSLIEGILPAARKARYWELYKSLYKEIADELKRDFQRDFGAQFARAYMEQTDGQ